MRLADPEKGDTRAIAESRSFPSWQLPAATNESYFLPPIFKFLRAAAWQVVEYGGDCADLLRLLIVLLRSRHVKASKWALYSKDLRPQHGIVDVKVERGKMVIDLLFGLWFPRSRSSNGYYGIKELREESSPWIEAPPGHDVQRWPLDSSDQSAEPHRKPLAVKTAIHAKNMTEHDSEDGIPDCAFLMNRP